MDIPETFNIEIRFYQELNDFIRKYPKKKPFNYTFRAKRSIKDLIESLGVPHTEVDLILVNHRAVNFDYIVRDRDRISVYPMFESFNISHLSPLRETPLRTPRFILDVHLGKLARLLRMLGFDTDYTNFRDDPELAELSKSERRILLTCDRRLLMRKIVDRGFIIRNSTPLLQAAEVLNRLDIWDRISLFARCINCNGVLYRVEESSDEMTEVLNRVPHGVSCWCTSYVRCKKCRRIYWEGSHFDRMKDLIRSLYDLRKTDSS